MIRFLTFLLGRPYETCKSCETLKQQLELVQAEKKELLDTILGIVKPKVIIEQIPPSVAANPIPTAMTFARKRNILEARDREAARVIRSSPNLGRPDNPKADIADKVVSDLEKELGINEEESDLQQEVSGTEH